MKIATTRPFAGFRPIRCLALALTLALTACTSVTYISEYDEGLDRGVTAVQVATESFFTQLEHTGRPPSPTLSKDEQAFLDQVAVALTVLQTRAAALPKNEITSAQLALLKDSFSTLGELLKAGAPRDQVQTIRNAFNASTGAILKLELAKKRGGPPAA